MIQQSPRISRVHRDFSAGSRSPEILSYSKVPRNPLPSKGEPFLIDHQHQPSHVMVTEGTPTQRAPTWDWFDDLGSKVRNVYDTFVVRAPKISLRLGGSSTATSSGLSSPSSCATARDHLANHSKRRILSFRRRPPIADSSGQELGKVRAEIADRAEIAELRLAVLKRDTAIASSRPRSRWVSLHSPRKPMEQAPGSPGDHFKRMEGAAFVGRSFSAPR